MSEDEKNSEKSSAPNFLKSQINEISTLKTTSLLNSTVQMDTTNLNSKVFSRVCINSVKRFKQKTLFP